MLMHLNDSEIYRLVDILYPNDGSLRLGREAVIRQKVKHDAFLYMIGLKEPDIVSDSTKCRAKIIAQDPARPEITYTLATL